MHAPQHPDRGPTWCVQCGKGWPCPAWQVAAAVADIANIRQEEDA
jgi:hypothetical protein